MSRRGIRQLPIVLLAAIGAVLASATPSLASYLPTPRSSYSVTNGTVYAMVVTSDRVYIGGSFTAVTNTATSQRTTRNRLAAFDRATGQLLDWAPAADNTVRALAVSGVTGTVYVGGEFATLGGVPRAFAGAVTSDGAVTAWNPSPGKVVRDAVVVGDQVYLAGRFGSVGGRTRQGLARVSADTGALDTSFTANTTGGKAFAIALAANGTDLLVGGNFTAINDQPHAFLATVAMSDGTPSSWSPAPACSTCEVFHIVTEGTAIYTAMGGPGGRATKYFAGGANYVWTIRGDGDVQTVAVRDGIVYVGGHYGPSFGGSVRHQLAAVSADSGQLLPWNPNLGGAGGNDHPGVWALSADSDFLRVGGGFDTVAGVAPSRYAEFPTGP